VICANVTFFENTPYFLASRFHYNSFDHFCYSSCITRGLTFTLSLSTMQENYHWS